tara:strand:- start:333 stop:590 length:258 start_codon:yes stop_codon:yes gene_type:complete
LNINGLAFAKNGGQISLIAGKLSLPCDGKLRERVLFDSFANRDENVKKPIFKKPGAFIFCAFAYSSLSLNLLLDTVPIGRPKDIP